MIGAARVTPVYSRLRLKYPIPDNHVGFLAGRYYVSSWAQLRVFLVVYSIMRQNYVSILCVHGPL
jgi:hypothetical protein